MLLAALGQGEQVRREGELFFAGWFEAAGLLRLGRQGCFWAHLRAGRAFSCVAVAPKSGPASQRCTVRAPRKHAWQGSAAWGHMCASLGLNGPVALPISAAAVVVSAHRRHKHIGKAVCKKADELGAEPLVVRCCCCCKGCN